jgi:putative membrane protein
MNVNTTHTEPLSDPRVRFAAERTLLAWIRTGLALMGFGFVVARFSWMMREFAGQQQQSIAMGGWSLWIGVSLICLGVVVNLVAAKEHRRIIRALDSGEQYRPPAWSLGILVAIVIVILGLGMIGYLVALSKSQ